MEAVTLGGMLWMEQCFCVTCSDYVHTVINSNIACDWILCLYLLSFYSFGSAILYPAVKFFATINQMGRGLVMRCVYGLMEA